MKIKLTHKILALVLFSTLVSAGTMVAVGSQAVSTELQRQLRAESDRCIRLLGTSFVNEVAGASATRAADEVGMRFVSPPLDKLTDETIVDENVRLLGGIATIFVFDKATDNFIRRVTSIRDDHNHRISGTPLASDSPAQAPLRRGQTYVGPTVISGHPYYLIYHPTFDGSNHVNGALSAGYPMQDIYYDGYANIMWRMGSISLVLEALLVVAVALVAQRLFGPLQAITRRIEGLMKGDLVSPLPNIKRTDEIGEMAASVTMFQQALQAQKETDEANKERSLDDLRRANLIVRSTQSFESTAVDLIRSLSASVHDMDQAADAVADSSQDTKTEASTVFKAAQDAKNVLDSLALTAQDLSRSAASISSEMLTTSSVASSALREATTTTSQVETLVAAAHEIDTAARFIDEIARQTNLLALNATIEAANAGASGRGFAIVAGEVKFLAKRTAEATQLINSQIEQIQKTSARTAEGIRAIRETLDHMNIISAAAAAAMTEQGKSSDNIAAALLGATDRARIVLESIGHVNVTAVANGERASDLRTKAARHGEQASDLSGFISRFVSEMRETA